VRELKLWRDGATGRSQTRRHPLGGEAQDIDGAIKVASGDDDVGDSEAVQVLGGGSHSAGFVTLSPVR